MLQKLTCAFGFIVLISSAALAQSQTMYIGDVELRLGMSRDAAMKALTSKYNVTAVDATSFFVTQYDERKKLYNMLGSVGFENNNKLVYISRDMDTSAWPNEEGFAVARALYDTLDGSIALTDSDGAKRANAGIVIGNRDAVAQPGRGNIRSVDVFVNKRKISIIIWSSAELGKSVSVSVAIRVKPW